MSDQAKSLLKAAKAGDIEANYAAGVALLKGTLGLKRRPEVALDYLRKASEGGKIEAINRYADLLRSNGKFDEAEKVYKIGVEKHNSIESMISLGKMIQENSHDDEKSDVYFKLASDNEDPEGMYLHAVYLFQQEKVDEATELFENSWNMGYYESLHMLSVIKNDDDELEEQYKIERKSHQKAELEEKKKLADEGDGEAMLWLVEKYKKEPLRRIRIESYYYMKKLAKIGDIPSMRYLAFSYKNARDVDIDMKEYLTYTKMLADEGEIDAMLKTAECYRDGIGCDQDPETSKRYYNKAFKATTQNLIAQIKEDKNNTDGLYKFSNQLLNGDVYEKNFDYGLKLLQTAASYGNQDAISDIINYFLRSGLVDTTEEEITKFLKLKKDPEYVFDLANQFLSGKLKIVGKSKVKEFDPNGPIVSFFKETAVEEEHYKLLMKFALCYREGKHQFLPKDTKEAARLFRIIIDKLPENHEAVSRLVSMYENNEIDDVNENEKEQLIKLNKKLELVHLKERADAGTSNCGFAMVNYANALIKNNIDVEEAFKYLKGAAINHKITIAMLELGEIFERGEIVEKNLEESLFYYGLGEQSKDSACALNYTKLLLCENRGDEAVEVIKNFGGERFVDKLFNKMRYEWRFSPEQNVQMLKQAADAGDVSCMKILAQYLFDGRNVAHNHQEAKKYEEMAKQYE